VSGRYFGVDGCAGGWALVELVDGRPVTHLFVAEFAGVLERTRDARLVLVDIPIGLPDAARGERRCDVLARKVLGDRGSCVFPAPVREVLDLPERCTQEEASARQRQVTGRGLTMQAYCLLPKIREVDGLMRQNPRLQETVRESHPELCFAALNGGNPVQHGKLSREGRSERLAVLRRYVPDVDAFIAGVPRSRRRGSPAADDVLDALSLAVNAWLGSVRGFRVLPDEGEELDRYGLRMEMVTARPDSAIPGGEAAAPGWPPRVGSSPAGHRE